MEYQTYVKVDDDEIINYIQTTKRPEEVFSEAELKEYITDNFQPNDVFDDVDLIAWAEANGFASQGV